MPLPSIGLRVRLEVYRLRVRGWCSRFFLDPPLDFIDSPQPVLFTRYSHLTSTNTILIKTQINTLWVDGFSLFLDSDGTASIFSSPCSLLHILA